MNAYRQKALAALGKRNPITVQKALLPKIRKAVSGRSAAALRRPEKPGKWSAAQVIQHLADTELVFGRRIRLILAADKPRIQAFDEDGWAKRLRYEKARPEDALDQLEALRTANLRLTRNLSPAALKRVGVHEERGPETLGDVMKTIAAHDLIHLKQLDRILGARA